VTEPHGIRSPVVAVAVLLIAMALEGYALRTAVGLANRTRGGRSWPQFIRAARAPEVPVILLEDSGALVGLTLALIGVGLTVLTGNGIFDGLATLAIGVLLVAVAMVLGRETKSLLIGESATKDQADAIVGALLAEPDFDRVIHLRTLHLGPDELLVAAKVAVGRDDDAERLAGAINSAEARIRKTVPAAKIIYLEPDIYRPPAPGS
jgi:divalent metal cation (Fe/Co/Zn/Cd) transporter